MAQIQIKAAFTLHSHADWSANGIEAIGLCMQGKGRLRAVSGRSKGTNVWVPGANAGLLDTVAVDYSASEPQPRLLKGPKGQERKTCRWGG